MHAVIDDLHPWQAVKEGKKLPRRHRGEAHFHVDEIADHAIGDQAARGHDKRGETQLAVDGGMQAALPADFKHLAGLGKVLAHRLLDEHVRAARQAAQRIGKKRGRQGEVEDHIIRHGVDRSIKIIENIRDAILGGQHIGTRAGAVVNAPDGKSGDLVCGEVRIPDDATGADDEDRERRPCRQNGADFGRVEQGRIHATNFIGKMVFCR